MLFSASTGRWLCKCHNHLINQKRYNVREQLSRYHEPDKFKKHMLHACKPFYKPNFKPQNERCFIAGKQEHVMDPLHEIYAEELFEDIKATNAILFIQHNYTPFQSYRVYRNTIIKSGGKFQSFNNHIYRKALKLMNWNHFDSLLVTRTAAITAQAESLPALVKAIQRMPQFILLAGSIDGNLIDHQTLLNISNSPTLDQARINLSMLLHSQAQTLTNILR